MRVFGRFLKWLFYAFLIGLIIYTAPRLYHKYGAYLQQQKIFTRVQKAENQVTNKAAPADWQSLNSWWLVNQSGSLIYNDQHLSAKDQQLTRRAAQWWNKAASRDVILAQTNKDTRADIYLGYVNDKLLNFSGLTGTNHVLLLNKASFDTAETDNDTLNVLIHELGHGLGLAHAPQSYNDVMSPKQIVTGEVKAVSTYDTEALKASFQRMASALNQGMPEANYSQVAAQTPYPDLNRLGDETFNARDGLTSTLSSTLTKAKRSGQLSAAQEKLIAQSQADLKQVQNDEQASDQAIQKVRQDLQNVIRVFDLQSYFPQAYPDSQSDSESEKIGDLISRIQGSF